MSTSTANDIYNKINPSVNRKIYDKKIINSYQQFNPHKKVIDLSYIFYEKYKNKYVYINNWFYNDDNLCLIILYDNSMLLSDLQNDNELNIFYDLFSMIIEESKVYFKAN